MKNQFKLNKDIAMDVINCCTHYTSDEYEFGYVMYKPFKILRCKNCETVHLVCNKFWAFIFEHILSYFWDGTVYLTGEYCKIKTKNKDKNEEFE